MHRVETDLPRYGGCLHFMPCKHYSKKIEQPLDLSVKYTNTINRFILNQKNRKQIPNNFNQQPKSNSSNNDKNVVVKLCQRRRSESDIDVSPRKSSSKAPMTRTTSLDDLIQYLPLDLSCTETLEESPNGPASPETPAGTESLRTQLRARASQIVRSLGFTETSVTNSMRALRNNLVADIIPKENKIIAESEEEIEEHIQVKMDEPLQNHNFDEISFVK